jgi:hypothetical protein
MVTCLEWVGAGKKIACVMEGPDDSWTIPLNVINTYCYVMTTFTLPKHWTTQIGIESSQLGVGNFNPKKDEVHYKAYYQWVSFVLFFQALTFYAPHYIFKVQNTFIRVLKTTCYLENYSGLCYWYFIVNVS